MQPITASSLIRVVLADDQPVYLDGLRLLLKKCKNMDLVGEADNGIALIELVEKTQPHIVITNVHLPQIDGIEATRTLVKRFPALGVIAHTIYSDEQLVESMMEAGARGYILKNAPREEVVQAIKKVSEEGTYYCSRTAAKLKNLITRKTPARLSQGKGTNFNEREIRIIQFICHQYCNKQIADKLKLTTRAVESARERIQQKTGAVNMVGIALYAVEHGIYRIG